MQVQRSTHPNCNKEEEECLPCQMHVAGCNDFNVSIDSVTAGATETDTLRIIELYTVPVLLISSCHRALIGWWRCQWPSSSSRPTPNYSTVINIKDSLITHNARQELHLILQYSILVGLDSRLVQSIPFSSSTRGCWISNKDEKDSSACCC